MIQNGFEDAASGAVASTGFKNVSEVYPSIVAVRVCADGFLQGLEDTVQVLLTCWIVIFRDAIRHQGSNPRELLRYVTAIVHESSGVAGLHDDLRQRNGKQPYQRGRS